MGRKSGKLKVEFIENQKSRNLAFKRRNQCVMKKMKELSTLCDVNACLVLFPLDHDVPTVWPPNDPAQVGGLFREFKGNEAPNAIGVFLQKKIQLARAKIDQLKKSQKQRELMGDDADQQQQEEQDPQFGPTIGLDNSSTAMAQLVPRIDDQFQFGPVFDLGYDQEDSSSYFGNNYPEQQQQCQLFGPPVVDLGGSSSMYQEEEDLMMMMMMPCVPLDTELKQSESMGCSNPSSNYGNNYPHQQQYELFGSSSPICQEDLSTGMMMDDCGMRFDEQTSRETAAANDDFYDGGLITQLYTPPRPPMMMWQSTEDDLVMQFQDFDDLWV